MTRRRARPHGLIAVVDHGQAFYEWAEKLVVETRVDRGARRRAVFSLPTVAQLSKDYTLRNTLVTTKNKDHVGIRIQKVLWCPYAR